MDKKILPAIQETQLRSLGWEDPLERGKATHSSILAWEIPWTEQPDSLQSMGSQELDTKPPPWRVLCYFIMSRSS